MTKEYGDMWVIFPHTDLFLITTNSFVKRTGELVMGAGIARAAAERYPELPRIFGDRTSHLSGENGLIIWKRRPRPSIGAFQVKRHWRDRAEFALIESSARELGELANNHEGCRFDMNFPGIGNGKLLAVEVLPLLLEYLPDNVHVWQRR